MRRLDQSGITSARPRHSFPGMSTALGVLPAVLLAASGCGDSCHDCPDDAHSAYICGGIVTPSCGTFCISGSTVHPTIINDCCCDDGKPVPTEPPRAPAEFRPIMDRCP